MDFEDEPAPWQLEQLLFFSSEIDYMHEDGQDQDSHLRTIHKRLAADPEYFRGQLRQLLDMIHEDDPLLQTIQSKSCVPILKGKFRQLTRSMATRIKNPPTTAVTHMPS